MRLVIIMTLSLFCFLSCLATAQEDKVPGRYLLCLKKPPKGIPEATARDSGWFQEQVKEKLSHRLTFYHPEHLPPQIKEDDLVKRLGETTHVVYYWVSVEYQIKGFEVVAFLKAGVEIKRVVKEFVEAEILVSVVSDMICPGLQSENDQQAVLQRITALGEDLVSKTVVQIQTVIRHDSASHPKIDKTPATPASSEKLLLMWGMGVLTAILLAFVAVLCFLAKTGRIQKNEEPPNNTIRVLKNAAQVLKILDMVKTHGTHAGPTTRTNTAATGIAPDRRNSPSPPSPKASPSKKLPYIPQLPLFESQPYACNKHGTVAWEEWVNVPPHCVRCCLEKSSPEDVLGSYRLVAKVREDSFGAYFLARDLANSQLTLLHKLPAHMAEHRDPQQWPRMLARFQRAQGILNAFPQASNRPNLVVPDCLQESADHSCFYYTIPYLPAYTLEEVQGQLWKHEPPHLQQAVSILGWLARIMYEFHAQGIVHREIKPERILCHVNHSLYLTGFFLLKQYAHPHNDHQLEWGEDLEQNLTGAHRGLGDIAYAPGEQIFEAANVNDRADIWAWGVAAGELFLGKNYFDRQVRSDTIRAIKEYKNIAEIERWQDTPRPLARLIAEDHQIGQLIREVLANTLVPEPDKRISSEELLVKIHNLWQLVAHKN